MLVLNRLIMGNLATLRGRSGNPLTADERQRSDELFADYCARPQHCFRLTRTLIAALRAAANRVARHGMPPNRNARLAYRMHKKRRARELAIAIYGDPNAPDTATLIRRAEGCSPGGSRAPSS
jgi:hypothetical protein